jgi:hypothetical protein
MVSLGDTHWGNFNKFANLHQFLKMSRVQRVNGLNSNNITISPWLLLLQTIGYDPIIPAEVSATFNTEWMELEDLWPKADYITVHTPLIPQTRSKLNETIHGL